MDVMIGLGLADVWKGKGKGDGFEVQFIERLSRLLDYALA